MPGTLGWVDAINPTNSTRAIKNRTGHPKAVLLYGLLNKTDRGQVVFPYDAVHVDFMLRAA
jgi:hypothetical protein